MRPPKHLEPADSPVHILTCPFAGARRHEAEGPLLLGSRRRVPLPAGPATCNPLQPYSSHVPHDCRLILQDCQVIWHRWVEVRFLLQMSTAIEAEEASKGETLLEPAFHWLLASNLLGKCQWPKISHGALGGNRKSDHLRQIVAMAQPRMVHCPTSFGDCRPNSKSMRANWGHLHSSYMAGTEHVRPVQMSSEAVQAQCRVSESNESAWQKIGCCVPSCREDIQKSISMNSIFCK